MICVFSDSRFMWNYTGAGSAVISVQQQFTESPYHETASDIAVDQRNGRCWGKWTTFSDQNQLCLFYGVAQDSDRFSFMERFNACYFPTVREI